MKISELSHASQVPVATIKFYIREGLLPAGQRTAKNQADYGARHVERLALIRALQDAAGLRLDTIARALRAADTAKDDFVIAAIDALERPVQVHVDRDSDSYAAAEHALLEVARKRGWKPSTRDASVRDAINALTLIKQSFGPAADLIAVLEPYFQAVELLAAHEIPDDWAPDASPEAALHYALLGTVLFEPLILALRRVAHVTRARNVVKQSLPAAKQVAHNPATQRARTDKKKAVPPRAIRAKARGR